MRWWKAHYENNGPKRETSEKYIWKKYIYTWEKEYNQTQMTKLISCGVKLKML